MGVSGTNPGDYFHARMITINYQPLEISLPEINVLSAPAIRQAQSRVGGGSMGNDETKGEGGAGL